MEHADQFVYYPTFPDDPSVAQLWAMGETVDPFQTNITGEHPVTGDLDWDLRALALDMSAASDHDMMAL